MTHIENIPHILQYGITHKDSIHANPNYVTIGDRSLIETRSGKSVNIDNGGNVGCRVYKISLGDYIPFYFGVRMPMLYVMQHGGNFVEKATPPQDIIYVICRIGDILKSGNPYCFSNAHATDSYTSFYDSTMIEELPQIINWNAVKAAYWGGTENLEIKREKQAEFLIKGDIPPQYLYAYGCYNDTTKKRLIAMGIKSDSIKINNNAFY